MQMAFQYSYDRIETFVTVFVDTLVVTALTSATVLSRHIHLFVHMYAHMHVHMSVHMPVHLTVHMPVFTHVYPRNCTHALQFIRKGYKKAMLWEVAFGFYSSLPICGLGWGRTQTERPAPPTAARRTK